ncbi:uncharacterized protein [Canis lupus baileyi]|uniref:uncharacterized protein n=1 Tax=Canis lupus baileyi TaxID=143281 RepID=UPI003B96A251
MQASGQVVRNSPCPSFLDPTVSASLCSQCSTSQVLLARAPAPTPRSSSTAPEEPDSPLQSSLSEPLENLSVPPSRAPTLPPPPPYQLPPQPTATPAPLQTPRAVSEVEPPPLTGAESLSDFPSSPPISAQTGSQNPRSSLVCPLREVAGAEGVVRVHAPFSLQDLSQIEKCLGSFSASPDNFIKEFHYLAQAYDLTWHDLHMVQTTTLTEERERIQAATRERAEQVHLTDATLRVFNSREEAAELKRPARLQQKVQLQTQGLGAALQAAVSGNSNKGQQYVPLFKGGAEGHWAPQCPNPKAPTKPCPQCHLMGHWKSDCPSLGGSSAPLRGGNPEPASPVLQLLGLEDD